MQLQLPRRHKPRVQPLHCCMKQQQQRTSLVELNSRVFSAVERLWPEIIIKIIYNTCTTHEFMKFVTSIVINYAFLIIFVWLVKIVLFTCQNKNTCLAEIMSFYSILRIYVLLCLLFILFPYSLIRIILFLLNIFRNVIYFLIQHISAANIETYIHILLGYLIY